MPRSSARCTQAMALAFCGPSEKVSQDPKAISETVSLLLPSWRYINAALRFHRPSVTLDRMAEAGAAVGINRHPLGSRDGSEFLMLARHSVAKCQRRSDYAQPSTYCDRESG